MQRYLRKILCNVLSVLLLSALLYAEETCPAPTLSPPARAAQVEVNLDKFNGEISLNISSAEGLIIDCNSFYLLQNSVRYDVRDCGLVDAADVCGVPIMFQELTVEVTYIEGFDFLGAFTLVLNDSSIDIPADNADAYDAAWVYASTIAQAFSPVPGCLTLPEAQYVFNRGDAICIFAVLPFLDAGDEIRIETSTVKRLYRHTVIEHQETWDSRGISSIYRVLNLNGPLSYGDWKATIYVNDTEAVSESFTVQMRKRGSS